MPPSPHWKFSASARIAEKQITMPIRMRKEIISCHMPLFLYVRLPEQSLRTEHEDDRDGAQRNADAIVRRDDERGKLAHHADDERSGIRAERAAEAAEDRGGEHADQVVGAHRRLERAVH